MLALAFALRLVCLYWREVRSTETPMEKPSDPVQRLRESTIREAGTGRVLEKPPAPAMRVVEKGAWTYREVGPESSRPEQPNGRREPPS